MNINVKITGSTEAERNLISRLINQVLNESGVLTNTIEHKYASAESVTVNQLNINGTEVNIDVTPAAGDIVPNVETEFTKWIKWHRSAYNSSLPEARDAGLAARAELEK